MAPIWTPRRRESIAAAWRTGHADTMPTAAGTAPSAIRPNSRRVYRCACGMLCFTVAPPRSAVLSRARLIGKGNRMRIPLLIVLWAVCLVISTAAQAPVVPPPGQPVYRFPAQQRPPDDPELVARGKRVYDISCRSCHGADLRGGDMGGPNLL